MPLCGDHAPALKVFLYIFRTNLKELSKHAVCLAWQCWATWKVKVHLCRKEKKKPSLWQAALRALEQEGIPEKIPEPLPHPYIGILLPVLFPVWERVETREQAGPSMCFGAEAGAGIFVAPSLKSTPLCKGGATWAHLTNSARGSFTCTFAHLVAIENLTCCSQSFLPDWNMDEPANIYKKRYFQHNLVLK